MTSRGLAVLLAALAAVPARGAAPKKDDGAASSQDITIKGKGPRGPEVQLPTPRPEKAVVDEVIGSLELVTGEHRTPLPKVKLAGGSMRLQRPFPAPPYLVFSPKTFAGPWDRWTFEAMSGDKALWRLDGTGRPARKIS